jgi:hypothetical protein
VVRRIRDSARLRVLAQYDLQVDVGGIEEGRRQLNRMTKAWRRTAVAVVLTVLLFVIAAGAQTEIRHHAQFGHWMRYGWHGDVISEASGLGTVVPGVEHVQKAVMTNFTLLPSVIEACIEPNDVKPHEIPVFPFRIEKLDHKGQTWQTLPPSRLPMCLNLPIR